MKKKQLFLTALVLQMCFSIKAFTQESNLKENYSEYLPNIRAINKMLMHDPRLITLYAITSKSKLDSSRQLINSFASAKTILQPTHITIKGPGGNIPLTIFKPDTIRAVVLDIHGGGWCTYTAANDAAPNDEMARTCNVAVVSIDYRLAPEFPFPACIEDCKAAAKWLIENAKEEFGTDKLFISGFSAGAHLAAVTALYVRDSLKAIDKIKGLNLLYGCYDLGGTPSIRMATDSAITLNKRSIEDLFQLVFKAWTMLQLQNPAYSPLYANLKGMPPAIFSVGTGDPLLDDTYFMEARWRSAGNKSFLAVYPQCPHGFNLLPYSIAKVANTRIYNWISERCN